MDTIPLFYIESITFLSLLVVALIGYLKTEKSKREEYKETYFLWSLITILVICFINYVCYDGAGFIVGNLPFVYVLPVPIDLILPVIPFFIVFYLMFYVVVSASPFILGKIGGVSLLKKFSLSLISLGIISFFIYILFPTSVPRAYNFHSCIFDHLLYLMYNSDQPINCLPSLHNGIIWLIFFLIFFNNCKKRYTVPIGILATLVSASTLFCKQHYIVDILFTIPLVYFLAKKFSEKTF